MNDIILEPNDYNGALDKINAPATLKNIIKSWQSEKQEFSFNTSGSTGTPKKITISRDLILKSAIKTINVLDLDASYTALVCLPIQFIAGFMMVIRALETGMSIHYLEPKGNPMDSLQERKYFAAFVPLQLENILAKEDSKIDTLKKVIIGGAAMSKKLIDRCSIMKGDVYATYGMTETISHIALRKVNGPEADLYFKVLDNVEIIQSQEETLMIMADVTDNKWINTNDMVQLHINGFSIKGRLDNVINSGGIKVSPEHIEYMLSSFAILNQISFSISSIQDDRLGEKMVLVIEGIQWEQKRIQELQDELSSLSKFEKPRGIHFVQNFPRTLNGKIKRLELKKLLLSK